MTAERNPIFCYNPAIHGEVAERLNAAVSSATADPPMAEKLPITKMSCVYILKSKLNGKHYVGSSHEESARTRFAAHNGGKVRSTKSGRPWELIYEEKHPDYTSARKRENYLKSGSGRDWIKAERWQSG